jgi:glycosidase
MRTLPPLRLAAALLAAGTAGIASARDLLHVPSPDWRDQIVYFAMIDRFDDGDPGNNDQGAGEYDPRSGAHYSGGDLAGLERRLDYIQGLGATALWITPPVAHQWWDGEVNYGGYHGYWGQDFARIDPHFGDLAAYQSLSRALHARGMVLIQDVVVNHVGNWFGYADAAAARDPASGWRANPSPGAQRGPASWPYSQNDARDPAQRALDVYHWTPNILDYADPVQERTWQLASLDDLNTENPLVRRALRRDYGHWIRAAGVDALRIDTAFYVPPEYFVDFLDADDPSAPGLRRVAAATGRSDLLAFGEGFGLDAPFEERQSRKIEGYVRAADGRARLPSMLNFPLYGSLLDTFARGRASAVLGDRIERMQRVHSQLHRMPTFVDNHDVERFLAGGSEAGLKQALLAIHALPGIPVIYYGTEQGLREPRAAMFARGYGAQGRDRFDPETPLYRYLRGLAELRRAHLALRRGTATVLDANPAAPGALLYAMRTEADTLLVAFNSAEHPALLAQVETGLAPGAALRPQFSIEGDAPTARLDAQGRLTVALAPRSGYVWGVATDAATDAAPAAATRAVTPTLHRDGRGVVRGDLVLHGEAHGVTQLQLVLDGDLAHATPVTLSPDGRWRAQLDTAGLIDPAIEHRVVAWSPTAQAVSPPQRFRVERRWHVAARVPDPHGDDRGPQLRYEYPQHPDWREHRPGDLHAVTVSRSGGSLRIEVALADLISRWNAPNGFDHVLLTVFLELPGRSDGARAMPLQNDDLPDGMRWHYRLRVGGWSNALFSSEGADAAHEGTPVAPAATLQVERERGVLRITLPARALGDPATLAGARLYLNAWDYDGAYRALHPQAAAFGFGGGDDTRDPKWIDQSEVLTLR